jgi:hypothetical protein
MVPLEQCPHANLGVINFNSVTLATLQSVAYSNTPIRETTIPATSSCRRRLGGADQQRQLRQGKVVAYGYDLTIQWGRTHRLNLRLCRVLGSGYNQPET